MLPRKRIFAAALFGALILIFPLRVALAAVSPPLAAPFVGGFVWGGRIVDARIAGIPLGDLQAGLSPLDLLAGRAKIWLEGRFSGALVAGLGGRGADVKSLSLPLGRSFGAVTLTQIDLTDARIRFAGDACSEANGRLQLSLAPSPLFGGQSARFTGNLRCEGDTLATSLASQSGLERLALRIEAKGAYTATLTLRAQDEAMAAALRTAGFRETSSGFAARLDGQL